ncbi:MAG: hypothetical protein IT555_12255 [Acetobacteraceae bacterium]|nr:hypothetical protein [Acetobacteraceae bacterium]
MTGGAWAAVVAQKDLCLDLMREIAGANARILQRAGLGAGLGAGVGAGVWARMGGEGYNSVCRACHERRNGGGQPDAFFDAVCAEPDIGTVCKRKWELGETLDAYRAAIVAVSPAPADHDALERLVRRSVTAPDRTPQELADALARAIALAEAAADAPAAAGGAAQVAGAGPNGTVPAWFPLAGVAFSAVTVLFLMYLVVVAPPRDESRRVFDVLMALCVASASAFLGGTAAARGKLPLFKDSPVQFSAVGGVAVFVVVFLLMRYAA